MRIPFNSKFAHETFRDEVLELEENVHCLTFQTPSVLEIIRNDGIYIADYDKSIRQRNKYDYRRITSQLGFMPIWVFNPLQFGDKPQTTWDDSWFAEGSLWNMFIEMASIPRECTERYSLLEISVEPKNLYPDPALDYGYISVTNQITKEMLVGSYALVYPDEEADDWFYPYLYPDSGNSNSCSFKDVKQYAKIKKQKDPFVNAASIMGG